MVTPFQLLQDDWLQIAPLGDHPHQLGIQRVTAESNAAMANRFNTFRARLGRLFSGVPLFEGHHDTDPEKYPNGKSFAWVMELQDRAADGLWGRLKWTNEGRALVESGNYKFISPVWNARQIGNQNGRPVYAPENLLSLALTNLPNLPLPPLANSKPEAETQLIAHSSSLSTFAPSGQDLANNQTHMQTITDLLELPNEATPDQICEAVTRLKSNVTTVQNEIRAQQEPSSAGGPEGVELRAQLKAERTARIELILANAIEKGRINLATRI